MDSWIRRYFGLQKIAVAAFDDRGTGTWFADTVGNYAAVAERDGVVVADFENGQVNK